MIGEEELFSLPKGAIVVNIARGEILQEKALYDSLISGKVGAAGLDVWYEYPESEEERRNTPPSKYPFHQLDNVVMSPHRAGGWTQSEKQRMEHLAYMLNRAARGEPLENLVDLERGY
jgi:phosphoglycerate dehydrogenase-like enzyme